MSFGIKRMAVALQFLKHIILDHYSSPNVQIDPSFFNFRTPVPIWNVCCSMSSSNCCFFTCIQVSQEAGQVVWYSHLFQSFPPFVVIHTVRNSLAFLMTHVHWVSDCIQPSHPLASPSSLALDLSQHRGLFQWALCIWWPKYQTFSFSIGPSNEYSRLISFRIDWFGLLAVQGTLKSLLQHDC